MRRLILLIALPVICLAAWEAALAQGEVSSRRTGYYGTEASTGRYDDTEAAPRGRGKAALLRGPEARRFAVSGDEARNRMFLADSHAGIPYYRFKKCEDCHSGEVRNSHTMRGGISCRQCHGPEPIASVEHFFSRLNPIRRHAYVCAKCHEGAGASFGLFMVHEPDPFSAATLKSFPELSFLSWGMTALFIAVMALFVPHTILWMLRELRARRAGGRP